IACLSGPVVSALYGAPYAPLVPVLAVLALFAIPKALLPTAQNLLQASDEQTFLVKLGGACAIVNILLDVLLVGKYGAVGAAFGSGVAQGSALAGTCWYAHRRLGLRLQVAEATRIVACGLVMGAVAVVVGRVL